MKIYTRSFDSSLNQIVTVETEMAITFRSAVNSISDLPSSDNQPGDVRLTLDTDHLYVYVNNAWVDQGNYDIGDLLQDRLMQDLS
jgi:hypothetical protein